MSRRYQEQVEVRLGPAQEHGVRVSGVLVTIVAEHATVGVPTVFLRRGRVYLVRAVLAQWSQRVPWWRSGAEETETKGALEHRVWRVEARAGRSAQTGVYDLVQGEQWWLERVAD